MSRWHFESVEDRFWSKVDRRGYDECWPWTAGVVTYPGKDIKYGQFGVGPGQLDNDSGKYRSVYAHRVAFRLVHGRWPDPCGLHGCDFGLCCNAENPAHVHEGSIPDNNREMRERGRGAVPAARYGIEAGRGKLTAEQVAEILARYVPRVVSQQALADEYGVSQASISWIVRGRRPIR
jgi:hypothetical protein